LEFRLNPPGNFDGTFTLDRKDDLYKLGLPPSVLHRHVEQTPGNALYKSWEIIQLYRDRITSVIPLVLSSGRIAKTLQPDQSLRDNGTYECFLTLWDDPSDEVQNGRAHHRVLKKKFTETFAPAPLGDGWEDPDPLGFITSDEMSS